jgi:tetratricopeptide (TPR) repeat protein
MAQENHIENPALMFYKALIVMEQGRFSEAEDLLASYTKTAWYIPANLAKIYERTYRLAKAIEFYQLAASMAQNPLVESSLYEQVANCYVILGRESDARRSYEYALQLNPDNITAAFALQKLERNQK